VPERCGRHGAQTLFSDSLKWTEALVQRCIPADKQFVSCRIEYQIIRHLISYRCSACGTIATSLAIAFCHNVGHAIKAILVWLVAKGKAVL